MRVTYTSQTTPAAPSPCDLGVLSPQVGALNLAGFTGCTVSGGELHIEFPSLADTATLSDADKANLDKVIAGYVYTAPAPPPNWVGLIDWAALTVPDDDLWALQSSKYGSFMNTAAMTGNWGAADGSGTGAASWYVKLKADVSANPGKYTATTQSTLATVAAKFSAFGVPINP